MDDLEWKSPIKWDDLGGKPIILENPHIAFGGLTLHVFLFPLFSWKVILDGLQIMLNSLQVDLAAQAFSQLEEVG